MKTLWKAISRLYKKKMFEWMESWRRTLSEMWYIFSHTVQ